MSRPRGGELQARRFPLLLAVAAAMAFGGPAVGENSSKSGSQAKSADSMTIRDYIDVQLREADRLDKDHDGRVTALEYQSLAGGPDGPQSQNPLPFEVRRKLVMMVFDEIDANKDGVLDRVELTAYAVSQFQKMDLDKDRLLSEDEFHKAQEASIERMKTLLKTLMPTPQSAPR